MIFKATAYNAKGYTFQFTFFNQNWNEVEQVAVLNLDALVAQDWLHRTNGPWACRNIDVTV